MSSYALTPIPAFTDNYLWLIHDSTHAWVVDPGDAAPVLQYLEQHHLTLCGMLLTHHHADHIGGVATLQHHFPAAEVIGSPVDPLPPLTRSVGEGDTLTLAPFGLTLTVLEVPGHTLGHIAYAGDNLLFCGDTLFAGGCVRVFEGTYAQMWHSLDRLRHLPAASRVCCAHEYTERNLDFALKIEPDNPDLHHWMQDVRRLRAQGRPTLPSTLAQECRCNPFLRVDLPQVKARLEAHAGTLLPDDPVASFSVLRQWKNAC